MDIIVCLFICEYARAPSVNKNIKRDSFAHQKADLLMQYRHPTVILHLKLSSKMPSYIVPEIQSFSFRINAAENVSTTTLTQGVFSLFFYFLQFVYYLLEYMLRRYSEMRQDIIVCIICKIDLRCVTLQLYYQIYIFVLFFFLYSFFLSFINNFPFHPLKFSLTLNYLFIISLKITIKYTA